MRECGLKSATFSELIVWIVVTPLAGVWIEIWMASQNPLSRLVTPLAGVWIEIMRFSVLVGMSLVTPLAGVWIEIL